MFDIFDKSSLENCLSEAGAAGIVEANPENDIILAEAIICNTLNSEELAKLCEDTAELDILLNESIIQEKTVIKFDKQAKMKRAEAQAALIIAREKNDRDFNKLLRVWKMRKLLLTRIYDRYKSQAKTRAKEIVRRMGMSKSKTVKKAAKRAS